MIKSISVMKSSSLLHKESAKALCILIFLGLLTLVRNTIAGTPDVSIEQRIEIKSQQTRFAEQQLDKNRASQNSGLKIVRRKGEKLTYNAETTSTYKIPQGDPRRLRVEDGRSLFSVCTLSVLEAGSTSSSLRFAVKPSDAERKDSAIEVELDERNRASSVKLIQGFPYNFASLPVLLLPLPNSPLTKGLTWNLNCGETPVPVWSMKGVVKECQGDLAIIGVTGAYRVLKSSPVREEYVMNGIWKVTLNTKTGIVESLSGSMKGTGSFGSYKIERSGTTEMTLMR